MTAESPLLSLEEVTKSYESPDRPTPLKILDRISLGVRAGESLAIVGPSGSGKSTLLQIMGTLDRPTSGVVRLKGQDLGTLGEPELAGVRNRRVGFVFQLHYLLPQCNVLENVLVPTLAGGPAKKGGAAQGETVEQRAERLLKRVGLGERMGHRPGQLSGGERQRVALVRALINQPQLLLADEPTGALDHSSAQQLGQLLTELNREEKVTLVVVTHAMELSGLMGSTMKLQDGKLVKA